MVSSADNGGILSGVRVIDMTSVVFGPLATQMLGDLGADVIKVESPEGDMLRQVQPSRTSGMGAAFLGTNRNKRSITLDLKIADDRQALLDLLDTADVFVSSVRPSALMRLGLSPEGLRERNSRLITVAAVGFGSGGPYSDKPAYDDSVQSVSGMAGLTTMCDPDKPPAYAPTILADKLGGVTAAHAIMAALYHRERTGQTQHVEVPMFETLVSFLLVEHMAAATFEAEPTSFGYQRLLVPHRRPVKTADGYITILPYSNAQWMRFFKAVGRDDMLDHPWTTDMKERSRNIGAVYDLVAAIAPTRTTAEWLVLTEQADIPAMPVRMLAELPNDPHIAATGLFQKIEPSPDMSIWTTRPPVRFSATPARHDILPPPRLGQHNSEILKRSGPPRKAGTRNSAEN